MKNKRPNYRLPQDDHLEVPEIKRDLEGTVEASFAILLARDWSLMPARDRREALQIAKQFGVAFAEECEEEANHDSYVNMCVWYAFNEHKVINDVEFALWESPSPNSALDPRIAAFTKGCEGRRAKKVRKAS